MIHSPAILSPTWEIYTWLSHAKIRMEQVKKWVILLLDSKDWFLTNDWKFVDRKEAARIAIESGQIKTEVNELQSYHLV